MNVLRLTAYERAIRAALWILAFAVPAFSVSAPLPHSAYALVPALAAVDGVTFRRAALWTVLVSVYEALYRIPPGTLAFPVAALAVVHRVCVRFIRLDRTGRAAALSLSVILRALLWAFGMAVLSVLWQSLLSAETDVHALYALWTDGMPVVAASSVAVAVLLRLLRWRAVRRHAPRYP